MDDKITVNKRLVANGQIVYPITLEQNVIDLTKAIKRESPKLIISSNTPSAEAEGQTWFDTSCNEDPVLEEDKEDLIIPDIENPLDDIIIKEPIVDPIIEVIKY